MYVYHTSHEYYFLYIIKSSNYLSILVSYVTNLNENIIAIRIGITNLDKLFAHAETHALHHSLVFMPSSTK